MSDLTAVKSPFLGSTADLPTAGVPADYEPCGECGYDHGYEYDAAYTAHVEMRKEEGETS